MKRTAYPNDAKSYDDSSISTDWSNPVRQVIAERPHSRYQASMKALSKAATMMQ
jgi:hypothetical protein